MKRLAFPLLIAAMILAAGVLSVSAAPAHHRHHHHAHGFVAALGIGLAHMVGLDARPRAWCGWFGRFNFLGRDPGRDFNLAANWRRIGSPDSGPHSGDIVVWPHHVGKIVGQCDGYRCPVWSGNDGHAVRTRMRSVSGAVFRRVL